MLFWKSDKCVRPGQGSYQEKVKKARRDHVCIECGNKISRGEEYEFVKGKWGSEWETYATCLDCCQIRNYIVTVHCPVVDDEPAFGYLYDFIREYKIPVGEDQLIQDEINTELLVQQGFLV